MKCNKCGQEIQPRAVTMEELMAGVSIPSLMEHECITERVVKLEDQMKEVLDYLRQIYDQEVIGRVNFPIGFTQSRVHEDDLPGEVKVGVPDNNYWPVHRYMYKVDDKDSKDER